MGLCGKDLCIVTDWRMKTCPGYCFQFWSHHYGKTENCVNIKDMQENRNDQVGVSEQAVYLLEVQIKNLG